MTSGERESAGELTRVYLSSSTDQKELGVEVTVFAGV
jgi:hypothetical protein